MKKQYAIFSDVDGTIYSHNQAYHPKVKEQIKEAQDKGIEFIMCTGNPYFINMQVMAKELNVDYFIGSNGAFIYDVKNEKELILSTIDKDDAQKILDIANKHKLSSDWWDSDTLYASEHVNEKTIEQLRRVVSGSKELVIQNHISDHIHKIEIYADDTPENIRLIDLVQEELEAFGLQMARMKPYHLEITNPKVSKGEAVKTFSEYLGIPMENVMTIGDSANDHSMLKITDYSYAMGNADPLTQEVAKLHTSSVEQNGLGEAIVDFMFRKRLTDNFKNQK